MQHITGAGKTAGMLHDALAEVIVDVECGRASRSDLVARLEQVQNGADFACKIVQASAGKLTNEGKDTLGGSSSRQR